jgi:hypothetical protein
MNGQVFLASLTVLEFDMGSKGMKGPRDEISMIRRFHDYDLVCLGMYDLLGEVVWRILLRSLGSGTRFMEGTELPTDGRKDGQWITV